MRPVRPAPASPRLQGDGGAVFVEFALILPFIALFLMGMFEFGNGFRQKTQLEATVASAARVNVQIGSGRFADFETLRAVSSGLSGLPAGSLQRVVVWKATDDANGPKCTTGPSVANVCNVYTAAQVADASGAGFPGGSSTSPTCPSSSWDAAWCPLNRSDTERAQDYVGVYVEVQYRSLTRVVSLDNVRLTSWAVYRIEPPLGAT
jgi:hypothetical protein